VARRSGTVTGTLIAAARPRLAIAREEGKGEDSVATGVNHKLHLSVLAALYLAPASQAVAQNTDTTTASPVPGATESGSGEETTLQTVVVTGSTSKRTLLDASVDITAVTPTDLATKAPRSTADVLELIPGIFVESTAGPVSNNYSVRGLPGGGQGFVMLQEDGMPIIYGGGGADEYFQNDITIDRVEAVQGGTSGILSVNGAGATINFLSKPLNFDTAEGTGRLTGTTYNEHRADLYYTAPLRFLGPGVAFSAGGYFDSTRGIRNTPFTYQTYHFKTNIEKRFEGGASIRFTYKRWDEHDPYYADQPYRYANGDISGVPGLNPQYGDITGPGFASIAMPVSCSVAPGSCLRTFSSSEGIHGTGNQYRVDINVPFSDEWTGFVKARFLQSNWNFNGIFAGSGSGNSGLASAVDYLTPGGTSPIDSLLTQGLAAFPGTTQFGIKNLTTGQVVGAANIAALNALNGNGLLQQTVLNRQYLANRDLGTDFGARYELSGSGWSNSLTVGGMYYHVRQYNDQSAVSTLINDVSNSSSIYDVVALNSGGNVIGTLTNNGLINYGDWGAGIWSNSLSSFSVYFNNELALLDKKLHIDVGVRREDVNNILYTGNTAAVSPPVPAGIGGLFRNVGSAFDGTFIRTEKTFLPTSYTIGANYTITDYLSVYARHANGNQTNGGNNLSAPTRIILSEAGVRFGGYGLIASVTYFHTIFNNQNYGFTNPDNPAVTGSFSANSTTNGVDVDATYRPPFDPVRGFALRVEATYQKPTLSNVFIGDLINGQVVNSAAASQYNGNVPQRTPQTLVTVQPSYDLPNRLGVVYARYAYIGKIYADSGDGLALPGYGVLSLGGYVDITDKLAFNVSVNNVTNELGLTEGNPRQGNTQSIVNGFFYGRGIFGTNALFSLTYRF
jgi:iron complex outermembrane recepter protein